MKFITPFFFFCYLVGCQSRRSDAEIDNDIKLFRDSVAMEYFLDSIYLSASIKSIELVDKKAECNLLVMSYVLTGFTKNMDSLQKCAEILTQHAYDFIDLSKNCGQARPRAGVFLYSSNKYFHLTKNFAAYSLVQGEPITGQFFEHNLK